jgi:hypothetical protein
VCCINLVFGRAAASMSKRSVQRSWRVTARNVGSATRSPDTRLPGAQWCMRDSHIICDRGEGYHGKTHDASQYVRQKTLRETELSRPIYRYPDIRTRSRERPQTQIEIGAQEIIVLPLTACGSAHPLNSPLHSPMPEESCRTPGEGCVGNRAFHTRSSRVSLY